MKTWILALTLGVAFAGVAALGPSRAPSGPAAVAAVLDKFHDAASRADENEYFGLFADDGVFLGTDGGERWTKEQFQAYARPYFAQGRGWTYLPRPNARFVTISTDGSVAWFDEMLDNAKYGECRGSGVLVRSGDSWRIVQYNLSVPVPNDMLPEVADMIRKKTATGAPGAVKDGKR